MHLGTKARWLARGIRRGSMGVGGGRGTSGGHESKIGACSSAHSLLTSGRQLFISVLLKRSDLF